MKEGAATAIDGRAPGVSTASAPLVDLLARILDRGRILRIARDVAD